MPVETRVKPAFAELVRQVIGGDTFGQACIKTGISKAYLTHMGKGLVPSRAIVDRFADGYQLDKETRERLLVAAGHVEPERVVPAVEMALPPVTDISEAEKADLLEVVKGYSSARHASTRHYIAEAVRKILEEEAAEQPDS